MPQTTRRRMLTQLGLLSAAIARPASAHAQTARTLTATDVHVSDYPTVEAVRWIGAELERETAGRLRLRLYHSGQLGREIDQVDMARHGVIDLTRVYSGGLHNVFPATIALGLPYVIDSTEHLRRVIDSPVGAQVLASFEARGLVGLAIYDSGARCIYNTRGAITAPGDLKGRKLRVPPSDVFMQLMRGFGANPTPLPYGEVFSAMQTHLIDGAENNLKSYHSSRQFEVAQFWSQTEHSYAPDILLMSKRSFDSLDVEDQLLLRQLARRSVEVMRKRWDLAQKIAHEAVLASGVKINAGDSVAFRKAAKPTIDLFSAHPDVSNLLKRIREFA